METTKIKVINFDGEVISLEEWQKQYNLTIGSAQIGKHFSYTEPKFQQDLKDYDQLIVNSKLMMVVDQFREDVGEPLNVNAFNRSEEKEKKLGRDGFATAKYSPHVFQYINGKVHAACAIDIDTISNDQTNKWVPILQNSAKKLKIGIRIGYKQYQGLHMTFIHIDVCPEYYASGKPWNKYFHPKVWEIAGTTW